LLLPPTSQVCLFSVFAAVWDGVDGNKALHDNGAVGDDSALHGDDALLARCELSSRLIPSYLSDIMK
jgi:hypothetical protein